MPSPVISVQGVSKTFPRVRALTDVRFELLPGEVHARMGENGAGKSTLMKIQDRQRSARRAGDRLKPAEIAKAMAPANPNFKGAFGADEGSAQRAATGVREAGKTVVLIGYPISARWEKLLWIFAARSVTKVPV